jgi:hypothetical protein
MDRREIEWGGIDWIDLAQNRDHWTIVKGSNDGVSNSELLGFLDSVHRPVFK